MKNHEMGAGGPRDREAQAVDNAQGQRIAHERREIRGALAPRACEVPPRVVVLLGAVLALLRDLAGMAGSYPDYFLKNYHAT